MDFPTTLTKKAIAKYRALKRSGKLSRGSDRGVTLAYALWLANGRQGVLRAGMEIIGKTRSKQTKAKFLQMVYEDPAGATWDEQGQKAMARCEKSVRLKLGIKRVPKQSGLPFPSNVPAADEPLHWQEVHPANLQWFAEQWGQDGIRTGDALRMMEVVMRFEGSSVQPVNPRQLGLIYPDEGKPESGLAPLNCQWYAQLALPKPRAPRSSIVRSDT